MSDIKQGHVEGQRRYRRGARGQSLVETALSLTILLLVFSGAVDLGRAFFAWVQLNNAATEGAHWAATYPGCIGTGATSDPANNSYANNFKNNPTVGVPTECRYSNSIGERILNEDSTLNRNDIKCVLAYPVGKSVYDATTGDTIQVKVKVGVTMITPLIRAMVGDKLYLYAQAQEVVRAAPGALPSSAPITLTDQGGLSPTCGSSF
jgi:Flp pilus assembly protein TadG